ncbi:filamentous hemagglutinin N-terminal domain-containing protein [Teredinibacter sp. KSP-S5-2]|uniref:filamentous hemagglutinin N-terminal domain-containing protein n=1 Tax=Teredinibacter sp. KSP-S5-2 TaxID=3034506 RepID=UPI00293474B1|nr:filamentous hemagglutinin N-terminal domain-containing protein [Teredinibacter sp. KSP-S5-2]WNO10470.1 filamentous hemagglutinin N-terminal domain-containing protein [Teredinibacter sp. KSP-S5-2]
MKRTHCPRLNNTVTTFPQLKKHPLSLAIGMVLGALSCSTLAGPQGGNVTGGSGNISQAGNTTTINQTTDKMVIDWQSYDVNVDERVHYIQPDSSSISLNNILSNSGSQIHGRIDANGQVILVNPNGIFFGENSVINAGGILASGLSINPDDFMNGDFAFSAVEGKDGVVINSGLINAATGGMVGLLGKRVENHGLIDAELGTVTLAAGKRAFLTFEGQRMLGIGISESVLQEELGVDAAVLNSGEINAGGGNVLLTATASQDVFTRAMNLQGVRQANSVVVNEDGSFRLSAGADVVNTGSIHTSSNSQGGDVVLVGENITHSGKITANGEFDSAGHIELTSRDTTLLTENSETSATSSNGVGGDIKLLGQNIGVIGESQITVDAAQGDGQVLIGGDTRGESEFIRNANAVYLGHNTEISANATETNSAGKIVAYGNELLRGYGTINAEGFGTANGGFIETSAGVVDLDLTVSVGAESGEGGEWLIDPWNITIGDAESTNLENTDDVHGLNRIFQPNSDLSDDPPIASNSYLRISSIKTALASTSSARVLIETTGSGGHDGDITLESELNYNDIGSNDSLVLRAHNDIFIKDSIYDGQAFSDDSLNLSLIADSDNNGSGDIFIGGRAGDTVYTAEIDLEGGQFYAYGNNFSLGFQTFTPSGGGDPVASASSITTGANAHALIFASGDVNIYNNITTENGDLIIGGDHDNSNYTYRMLGIDPGTTDADEIGAHTNFITYLQTGSVAVDPKWNTDSSLTADIEPTNVWSYFAADGVNLHETSATFDLRSTYGNGDLNITSLGAVELGAINIGETGNNDFANEDNVSYMRVSADTIHLVGNLVYGENNNNSTHSLNVNLNAETSITIDSASIDNSSGDDQLNLYLNNDASFAANGSITLGDNINSNSDITISGTDIWLTGGVFQSHGRNFTLENTATLESEGGDILIRANSAELNGAIGTRLNVWGESAGDVQVIVAGLVEVNGSFDLRDNAWENGGAGNLSLIGNSETNNTFTIGATTAFQGGAVYINGSVDSTRGGDDVFNIDKDLGATIYGGSGVDKFYITTSLVNTVHGAAGNDEYYINASGIELTIDDASGNDTLHAVDASIYTNTWDINSTTTLTNGDDSDESRVITFSGIENLVGGDSSVEAGTGKDTFSVSSDFTGRIQGGSGNDTFNLAANVTDGDGATFDIEGGDDVDTFNITNATITASIDGGAGTDTLDLNVNNNGQWQIDSADSGSLNTNITFDALEVLYGSDTGNDTFDFAFLNSPTEIGSFAGTIDARGGDYDSVELTHDTLTNINVDLSSPDFNGVQNAEVFRGDGDGNSTSLTITGGGIAGSNTHWNVHDYTSVAFSDSDLNGENDGVITNSNHVDAEGNLIPLYFINIGKLIGNEANDQFTVTGSIYSVDGTVDGANQLAGRNEGSTFSLSYDSTTPNGSVAFTGGVNYVTDFRNIQTLTAGTGSDTLVGRNQNNLWNINQTDGGSVAQNTVGPTDTIHFTGFENVTGNNGDDTFLFDSTGAISGIVDGGTGSNTLVGRAVDSLWELLTGESEGRVQQVGGTGYYVADFRNIDVLEGRASEDTLTARNQNNTWTLDIEANNGFRVANTQTPTDLVTFTGMDVLRGNAGVDHFDILTTVSASLFGEGGSDVFDFGDAGAVEKIDGGTNLGDNDTIEARSGENHWFIRALDVFLALNNSLADSNDSNYLTDFRAIETLQGSATSADKYYYSVSPFHTIRAGASAEDELDVSSIVGTTKISFDSNSGIELLRGNQNGLSSPADNHTYLTFESVTDTSVTWNIGVIATQPSSDGLNDGEVAGLQFINVDHLIGGAGNDQFIYDPSVTTTSGVVGITGSISGGNHTGTAGDTLQAANVVNTWNLSDISGRGSLAHNIGLDDGGTPATPLRATTQFYGIETVTSGDQSDNFLLSSTNISLTINAGGGTGDDTLTLPAADTSIRLGASLGNGLTVNGFETLSANADYNNQITVNSVTGSTVTWTVDGLNEGDVQIGSGPVTRFENFQLLIGGEGNDTFNLSLGGRLIRTAMDQYGGVQGGGGANTLIGQNVFSRWRITGVQSGELADMTNTASPVNYVEAFSGIQNLRGGSNNDDFILTSSGHFTGNIQGGEGIENTLTVDSVAGYTNQWRLLHASEDDQVQRVNDSDDTDITSFLTFSGITQLTGGTGADFFRFLNAGLFGGTGDNINAGDGTDTVDRSSVAGSISVALGDSSVNGVTHAERVIGNGANSTLSGLNTGTNSWRVSTTTATGQTILNANGVDDGVLSNGSTRIEFINFANLSGSDIAIDNFLITNTGNVTGQITGGANSNDSISVNTNNGRWVQTGVWDGSVAGMTFTGFESWEGLGGNDTLVGLNQDNDWQITGIDKGTVSLLTPTATNILNFSGMENLAGNQGNDEFTLVDNATGDDGQITGSISGTDIGFNDLGTDKLIVNSGAGISVTWNIGSTNNVMQGVDRRVNGFNRIENFDGGNGTDTFVIETAEVNATLNGLGGVDDVLRLDYANTTQWLLDGGQERVSNSAGLVLFEGIETVQGSNSNRDAFTVSAITDVTTLNGRGGDDFFDIQSQGYVQNILGGSGADLIQIGNAQLSATINGGSDSDTDRLRLTHNGETTWTLNASGQQAVVTGGGTLGFSNIDVAEGSLGRDIFSIATDVIHTLLGRDGNDQFTIATTTPLNITLDGGANAVDGFDELVGANTENIWIVDNGVAPDANTLNYDNISGEGVFFGGIEHLTGGTVDDTVTIRSAATVSQVRGVTQGQTDTGINSLQVVSTAGDSTNWNISNIDEGAVSINGVLAANFFAFSNLTGGNGTDRFRIDNSSAAVTGLMDGGNGGADSLDVTALISGVVIEVGDTVTLINPDSTDTLPNFHVYQIEQLTASTASAENNWLVSNLGGDYRWDITGNNDGQIVLTSGGTFDAMTFTDFGYLRGGVGDDEFRFTDAGVITKEFDGGVAGNDMANFANVTNDIHIVLGDQSSSDIKFSGIEVVRGNHNGGAGLTHTASLSVATGTNTWTIDAVNSGILNSSTIGQMRFYDFNELRGGNARDVFDLNAAGTITGRMDGGTNAVATVLDELNLAGVSSPRTVQLVTESDLATYGRLNVMDIEHFVGSGANSTLMSLSTGDNVWNITANNQGALNTLTFTGFGRLVGNDTTDRFTLNAGVSLNYIDGRGGDDFLLINTPDTSDVLRWEITGANTGRVGTRQIGDTNIVGQFERVENLTGGLGADTFAFTSTLSVIDGMVDGGDASAQEDRLVLSGLTDGVVVEYGESAYPGNIVDFASLEPPQTPPVNVHANNFETIIADEGDLASEALNWLAITHSNDIEFRLEQGEPNNGFFQVIEYIPDAELVDGQHVEGVTYNVVSGSRVNFFNFGSFQENSGTNLIDNITTGPGPDGISEYHLSGFYLEGTGRANIEIRGEGFSVVNVTDRILNVSGNGNTLLRVVADDENSEIVFNDSNTWTISAINTGRFDINTNNPDGEFGFTFSGVNQLYGGTGDDVFQFTGSGNLTGQLTVTDTTFNVGAAIFGNGGNDRIESSSLQPLTFGLSTFQNNVPVATARPTDIKNANVLLSRRGVIDIQGVETLIGNQAAITHLYSADSGNFEWNIGATTTLVDTDNAATLEFFNVDRVFGGDGNDEFTILDLRFVDAVFDGGAGNDTLDLTLVNQPLSLSLDSTLSADVIFNQFETLKLSDQNNSLFGAAFNSAWSIDTVNGGTVSFNDGNADQSLVFSNIKNIGGNSQQDQFTFSNTGFITGIIHGGANQPTAVDTITFDSSANQDVIFQVSEGDSTGNIFDTGSDVLDLVGIETLTANTAHNNTLRGAQTSDNEWHIGSTNTLTTLTTGEVLRFTGISQLTGGEAQDQFVFNGVTVSGLIDGGNNLANAADMLTIQNLNDRTVHLGNRTSSDINVLNVESISTTATGLRLRGDDSANSWLINNANAGVLNNTIAFTGFEQLIGGNRNDAFTVTNTGSLSGLLDGGANPTTGSATDTLNIEQMTAPQTVSLDSSYDNADFTVTHLETITAADNNNTLVGSAGNNIWLINNTDRGRLNATQFTGFANLTGREQVDQFTFRENGKISGRVDGGTQPQDLRDSVDMRELASVHVRIGDASSGFMNIEEYTGNNNGARLTAANEENTWTINETNGGLIEDTQLNSIAFHGFDILEGGDQVDRFTVEETGSVTGSIDAGIGQDRLLLQLGNGHQNGEVIFNGGDNDDELIVQGGDANNRFNVDYTTQNDGSVTFLYERVFADGTFRYSVNYESVETVNQDAFTDTLSVNPASGQTNTITLANQRVNVNDFTPVRYTNTQSLRVNGTQGDGVVLDGLVSLDRNITLSYVTVDPGANGRLQAGNQLTFDRTGPLGNADNRLQIHSPRLILTSVNGDTYLEQQGNLVLAGLSNPQGVLDIHSNGAITDDAVLTSAQAVRLDTNGDIVLDNANNLTGDISLLSPNGQVTLNNGATTLAEISARNLTLMARANVNDTGSITVAENVIIHGSDNSVVQLDHEANTFNTIDIQNAGSVVLRDHSANGITVGGNAVDTIDVEADALVNVNAISAASVLLSSNNDRVSVVDAVSANHVITLQGNGVTIAGGLSVDQANGDHGILIDGRNNLVSIQSEVDSTGRLSGDVIIRGAQVEQTAGAHISGRNLDIDASDEITLAGNLTADNTIDITSQNVSVTFIESSSNTVTRAQQVNVSAANAISTQVIQTGGLSLTSTNGNVVLEDDVQASNDIEIEANNGTVETLANADLRSTGNRLTIHAQTIELHGNITATQADGQVSAVNTLTLDNDMQFNQLTLNAGNVLMTESASAASQTILEVNSGGDFRVSSTSADEQIRFNVGGSVSDNNGDAINFTTNELIGDSQTGFGTLEDNIETTVSIIDVANSVGEVGVTNNQNLTVNALINHGDIELINTSGNVILNNRAEADYDVAITGTRAAGGVIDANYGQGVLRLEVQQGYVAALPPRPDSRRPELIGRSVDAFTRDGFGIAPRQIVVYAQDEMFISGPGIRPVWAFGERPAQGLITDSDLVDPSIIGSVADLLVDVEDIEEIDPAIFTNILNFIYEDIAIRMPRDQLYEDELEEERRRWEEL